jgi:hypothetical protein
VKPQSCYIKTMTFFTDSLFVRDPNSPRQNLKNCDGGCALNSSIQFKILLAAMRPSEGVAFF